MADHAAPMTAQAGDPRAASHARLGMAIFLGTWVMLFAGLFLAYAILRAQAPTWPPDGVPRLPRGATGLATVLLVASSLVLRVRSLPRLTAHLAAIALGLAFVAVQALVWRAVAAAGLLPSSGTYASVFFALTIFHALHVACGLVLLTVVAARRERVGNLSWLAATFWDFVTGVWGLIYVTVFWL